MCQHLLTLDAVHTMVQTTAAHNKNLATKEKEAVTRIRIARGIWFAETTIATKAWDFQQVMIVARSQTNLKLIAITTMVLILVVQNKTLATKEKETVTRTMTALGIWSVEMTIVIMTWDFHGGAIAARRKFWKMLVKIAGMDAVISRESVTGAVLVVGAVEKVGQEMDVMVLLGDQTTINVYLNLNHDSTIMEMRNDSKLY
jgi:CDP-diglyceride synthetase